MIIWHLLHFLHNVTNLMAHIYILPHQSCLIANNQTETKVMKTYYLPLIMVLISTSEVQAWTKYGGDANCKTIVASDNDETFTERAKGWTFGYISALNEIMQQRFQEPPEEEFIWQAVKAFCADNPDASHYVASASIYIEVLRDQGGPQ